MQKPRDIVCEVCGKPLSQDDFYKGKAVWLMGKNFCMACKSAAEPAGRRGAQPARPGKPAGKGPQPAAKGAAKTASGRVRAVEPTTDGESDDEEIRPKRIHAAPSGAWNNVAIVLAVVAVLSLGAFALFRGQAKTTDKADKAREGDDEKIYQSVVDFLKANPSDMTGSLAKIEEALNKLTPESKFRAELKETGERLAKTLRDQDLVKRWEAPVLEVKKALQDRDNEQNAIVFAEKLIADDKMPEQYRKQLRELVPQLWLSLAQRSVAQAGVSKEKSPEDLDAVLDFLEEAKKRAGSAGDAAKDLLGEIEGKIAQVKQEIADADMQWIGQTFTLTSADFLDKWVKTGNVKLTSEGEWILVRTTKPETEAAPTIMTPPEMTWRDFAIDISFRIEKKGMDLLAHCGGESPPFVQGFTSAHFKEGEDYAVTVIMRGKRLKIEGDASTDMELKDKYARRGGIGFRLLQGAEIRFYEIKIRGLQAE
ncbi:MAG: hypothetical protein RDV41_12125 [Planctomycetota bacterium]|nr:hypothetical protein [Planctomycetota bacterium]